MSKDDRVNYEYSLRPLAMSSNLFWTLDGLIRNHKPLKGFKPIEQPLDNGLWKDGMHKGILTMEEIFHKPVFPEDAPLRQAENSEEKQRNLRRIGW